AFAALGRLVRRAVDRRLEVRIAEATMPALRDFDPLARTHQLADQLFSGLVEDARAQRHAHFHVGAGGTGAVGPLPMRSRRRTKAPRVAEIRQRVEIGFGDRPDATALTTVAAVGT